MQTKLPHPVLRLLFACLPSQRIRMWLKPTKYGVLRFIGAFRWFCVGTLKSNWQFTLRLQQRDLKAGMNPSTPNLEIGRKAYDPYLY